MTITEDGSRKAAPMDLHVAGRVRARRLMLGVSQEKLGEVIGVTFQQVQKYEKGDNRIGAHRLAQIAAALDCTPQYFFDEASARLPEAMGDVDDVTDMMEYLSTSDGIALNRAFKAITDPGARRLVIALAKKLAGQGGEQ